jgi:ESX-1-secreted protein regulator
VGIAAADADLWGFCGDARGPVSRLGGPPGPARRTIVDAGVAMSEETTRGAEAEPALRSLADKMNWLIYTARPAGRGPCSNAEVADLIERTTGERVSYITIWKLRNGQAANPQMKLIEAMARTFGVPPGFFFGDFGDGQAGLLDEQVELLALVRDAGVSSAELRVILGWSTEIRRAVIHLISTLTAQGEAQRRNAGGGALAQWQAPDKGAVMDVLPAYLDTDR